VGRELIYALGPNIHRSWTGRLSVGDACEFSVTLAAPTKFIASKIDSQYFDDVQRLWSKHDVVVPPRRIVLSRPLVKPSEADKKAASKSGAETSLPSTSSPAAAVHAGAPKRSATPQRFKTKASFETPDVAHPAARRSEGAQERFTFDNFVVGAPNEFAYAVARQIATADSAAAPHYNPVVLHGANGIGKTHLLHAVCHAVETQDPLRKVKLISSEKFVNGFVSSVRGSGREGIEAFKSSLRDVDILIIDDAHFIADKPGSQEELLHTLISLVGEDRQVLIAADRHPDEIENASPRLKSYLCSGLVCKISAADYELRLRILDRLIAKRREGFNAGLAIPQNARDHLAARINATPRDLEGAFNQVVAQSELLGTPITLETIQVTLSDSRYSKGMRLTVDKIQRSVADEFSITHNDMTSKRRARDIARPRQVAMYLCKKLTKRSLPDIGRRFGGRDHTTVMHAVKRIDQLRAEDPILDGRVKALEAKLRG
jgi:chromosomal replication initiator protein